MLSLTNSTVCCFEMDSSPVTCPFGVLLLPLASSFSTTLPMATWYGGCLCLNLYLTVAAAATLPAAVGEVDIKLATGSLLSFSTTVSDEH